MKNARGQINALLVGRCALRSFLLQASWNFESLQGLGALYVLAPALRCLYQGEERKQAFQRHLGYFNSHPYLGTAILGSAIALEADAAAGNPQDGVSASDFNGMMMAPFAAMGDALFWGGIRPLAAVLALFFAVRGSLLACVVLLMVYNLPHLFFRFWGFFRGWQRGVEIVATIQRWHLPDLAIRIKEAVVILLGGLCAMWVSMMLHDKGLPPAVGFVALPVVGFCCWLARKGVSPLTMIYLGTFLALAVRGLK
ncbi:hypothetical protein C2E25_10680 [Geothermobacter hydrogeniphilus]|uniref:PTS system, mannose-specific IID component n=1 Tax=Geothermobacter hydrogeniphilus TaxID=1969733 RepID=A0A2K2H8X6_9BACT|nr:PTS system mannose/fructose/sorbose family transporter subunit IID [Geothermobacter hydrogeniphilus]PNU19772.1 hypothetical protein C2E25_10680 [Geothermobacter hydrogeniphilus]